MTDYTTPDAVRGMIDKQFADKDDRIGMVITAVSKAIDNRCNRPDGFVAGEVASARLFAGDASQILTIDETPVISSVAVKVTPGDSTYTAWTADQWIPFSGSPELPDFNHTPYTGLMTAFGSGLVFTGRWVNDDWSWPSGRRGLAPSTRQRGPSPPTAQVTARWGYALTIPTPIAQACIIETARMFKAGLAGFSDTLASQDLGKLIQMAKLHPSTVFLLEQGRYIRPAV